MTKYSVPRWTGKHFLYITDVEILSVVILQTGNFFSPISDDLHGVVKKSLGWFNFKNVALSPFTFEMNPMDPLVS